MSHCLFYSAADSPAAKFAIQKLQAHGIPFADIPSPAVTHLLANVPTKELSAIAPILDNCPPKATLIGGNLPPMDRPVLDLMQDPVYVAENAYITAHCALGIAMQKLPVPLRGCAVLVVGWGRIGKCLSALLKGMEAQVTVAARKESDRGMLQALGYHALPVEGLTGDGFRVIFNTVPAEVLKDSPRECLKIDLASIQGLGGEDVIHARGLPSRYSTEASGKLIAERILLYLNKEGYL